ncbi:MAG: hypothetical protein WAO14_10140, partial [Pseudolabrys sp.]
TERRPRGHATVLWRALEQNSEWLLLTLVRDVYFVRRLELGRSPLLAGRRTRLYDLTMAHS